MSRTTARPDQVLRPPSPEGSPNPYGKRPRVTRGTWYGSWEVDVVGGESPGRLHSVLTTGPTLYIPLGVRIRGRSRPDR